MTAVLTIVDRKSKAHGRESVTVTLSFRPAVKPEEMATLAFQLSAKAMEAVACEIAARKKEAA